jgi:hypothetical protein
MFVQLGYLPSRQVRAAASSTLVCDLPQINITTDDTANLDFPARIPLRYDVQDLVRDQIVQTESAVRRDVRKAGSNWL